mmetsp:Transcript_18503/g.30577  ORF Transcript_18503/g.30577 Transcript_18503/m.30577 type:complete len:119 (+) Transcript_18503:93-449(+)
MAEDIRRSGSRVGSKEKKKRTFQVAPNSVWWANAKAVSHAVGNDDEQSATIIFRVLVPRSSYSWYYPNGAWCISARLHQVKRRYFPVLTAKDVKDVEAARKIPKAVVTSSLSDESTQT